MDELDSGVLVPAVPGADTTKVCPILKLLPTRLFHALKSSVETLYILEIEYNVCDAVTVWVLRPVAPEETAELDASWTT
jgi:hypothetical protein